MKPTSRPSSVPVGRPLEPTPPTPTPPTTSPTDVEYQKILKRLGITEKNSKAPESEWNQSGTRVKPNPEFFKGKDVSKLKNNAFIHPKVIFRAAARNATALATVDRYYDPRDNPDVRLSPDDYQKRLGGIYRGMRRVLAKELAHDDSTFDSGKQPKRYSGGIAVVQGGQADAINAVTFRNGSIIFHRQLVDLADQMGVAVARSKTPADMMKRLLKIAEGGDQVQEPPKRMSKEARRFADGMLALVVGHELTHADRFHSAVGMKMDAGGDIYKEVREKESESDRGGTELAMRLGFSPMGEAAIPLLFTMWDALAGDLGSESTHPAGIKRYQTVYEHLTTRKGRNRLVFDGKNPPIRGAAYFDADLKPELRKMPTPKALRAFAEKVMQERRNTNSLINLQRVQKIDGANPPFISFNIAR